MALWTVIPTCDDPMSVYSAVLFCAMLSGGMIAGGLYLRWAVREFQRIDDCMAKYDDYIDETGKVVGTMATDIAVLRSAVQNIEKDGSETKDAIKEINKTLMNRLTKE